MKILNSLFRKNWLNTFILFIFLFSLIPIKAQTQDTTQIKEGNYKNIIRFNLSNWLIYDKALQFSYERLLKKKNRSISVFGGYQEFPININLNIENVELSREVDRSGYTIGADYRFYLAKENKYSAPHGIYLAPFASFVNFTNKRGITYNNSGVFETTNLKTEINMLNIGGVLGYQFVIKERFVIDAVVFGPAITSYIFHSRTESDLANLDSNEVAEKVIEALKEKFPLLKDIGTGKEVNKSGTEAFWSGGFRYSISIGYRF